MPFEDVALAEAKKGMSVNMNNKTIKSLYNGDYTCIEKPILENSKYSKTLSKCTSLQEELTHLVDK